MNNFLAKAKPQQPKVEKTKVIMFDTLTVGSNQVKAPSMFNVSNSLYSDPRYLQKTAENATGVDILIRRNVLSEIFKQRVFFLLDQAISLFRSRIHDLNEMNEGDIEYNYKESRYLSTIWSGDIFKQLEEKFPLVLDVTYVMDGMLTVSSFSDIANFICIISYKEAVRAYNNEKRIKEDAESLSGFLAELFLNIVNAFKIAAAEAKDIYLQAGYPDLVFSVEDFKVYNVNDLKAIEE